MNEALAEGQRWVEEQCVGLGHTMGSWRKDFDETLTGENLHRQVYTLTCQVCGFYIGILVDNDRWDAPESIPGFVCQGEQ